MKPNAMIYKQHNICTVYIYLKVILNVMVVTKRGTGNKGCKYQ